MYPVDDNDIARHGKSMDASISSQPNWNISITLQDVPGTYLSVCPSDQIQDVVNIFKQNPAVNGILLIDKNQLVGLVTREQLFEVLGRPYGNELFLNKTIADWFSRFGTKSLVFGFEQRVDYVARTALARTPADRYDPIVVMDQNHSYKLVDMHTLLTIQNRLLSDLYQTVHQISVIDPLTNVYNRRAFEEALNKG